MWLSRVGDVSRLSMESSVLPLLSDPAVHTGRARRVGFLLLALLLCAALGAAAYWLALQGYQNAARRQADQRADFYALTLQSELARLETWPRIAAFERALGDLLLQPGDPARRAAANRYLEDVQRSADVNAVFLIDAHGIAIASSNWSLPSSYVGQSYAFRPYFHEAMGAGFGRLYAIGNTTGVPGYFVAAPISAGARVIGVVAVKASLDAFGAALARSGDLVLLSDANGVVFLSSVASLTFRTLMPLSPAVQSRLRQTLQYGDTALTPLSDTQATGWPDTLRLALPGGRPRTYEVEYRPVGRLGWQIAVLLDARSQRQSALIAGIATSFAAAFVIAIALSLRLRKQRYLERRRAAAALQQAHEELEQHIARRTAELSQANVELANKVDALNRTQRMLSETRDQAVQAGKLAVLGQMAAGITHELNQPLAALNALSDNTVRLIGRGRMDDVQHNLTLISGMASRMGRIVAQIKAFARKGETERERVNVHEAIRNALLLIEPRRRELDAHIECAPNDDDAVTVLAGSVRLEQVLVNLLRNGLDAMTQTEPATRELTIVVEARADHVEITVTDNGPGLPEAVRERLFEPFFTTKPAGQGLGLGLAISQAIVEEFHGHLGARNAPGRGASFTLWLERG